MYPQNTQTAPKMSKNAHSTPQESWSARYGERHQLRRITEFPSGVAPPQRVRIYARNGHFVLQWWDPAAKTNLCQRIDGDLIDAISAARRIEQRLENFRSSGRVRRRLGHDELVQAFLVDLQRRADAGEVAAATPSRYRSALSHYLAFTETSPVVRDYPTSVRVDRRFALEFAAFLDNQTVAPNGHANARKRKLRGQAFILDAARAMYEWADDPERGACMPTGFKNPFRRAVLKRRKPAIDPLGEPEITLGMATEFLEACDRYQRALFAPLILYGLRATEPVFLFREHVEGGWLRVGCIPELAYTTKGLRDKRFPLLDEITDLWNVEQPDRGQGLILVRRSVTAGDESPPLYGASLGSLTQEFERRCQQAGTSSAAAKLKIRDGVIRDAGGLTYDLISCEFHRLARRLKWPACATLKDFRHAFATALVSAAVPEPMRRYLMGHAPGKEAIVTYTHLSGLADHYRRAVEQEYAPWLAILRSRIS